MLLRTLFILADDDVHVLLRNKNQSSTQQPEGTVALPAVASYKQQQLAVSHTQFVNGVTKQR